MAVESFSFDHVDDVELVDLLPASVAHFKEKPLTIDSWTVVIKF